jgi:hypothetical protein
MEFFKGLPQIVDKQTAFESIHLFSLLQQQEQERGLISKNFFFLLNLFS